MTTGARRASPREHGRQAARSKRDRPERAREPHNGPSHVRAAAGGALDPIEPNSATRYNCCATLRDKCGSEMTAIVRQL